MEFSFCDTFYWLSIFYPRGWMLLYVIANYMTSSILLWFVLLISLKAKCPWPWGDSLERRASYPTKTPMESDKKSLCILCTGCRVLCDDDDDNLIYLFYCLSMPYCKLEKQRKKSKNDPLYVYIICDICTSIIT